MTGKKLNKLRKGSPLLALLLIFLICGAFAFFIYLLLAAAINGTSVFQGWKF